MAHSGSSDSAGVSNGASPRAHIADVGTQRVARIYAAALLGAAAQKGQEEAALDELRALVMEVFREQPDYESFLSSLAIGRDRKAELIRKSLGQQGSEVFMNFLLVLNSHDRLNLLRPVLTEALVLRERRQGLMRVLVRSAVPLPDDQRQQLTGQLRQSFGKEPLLEEHVDPELLGGMIVRVGDWLYDASVRSQLFNIRNLLFESSSHEIQSRRDRFSSDGRD